jgi:hypothetical protein
MEHLPVTLNLFHHPPTDTIVSTTHTSSGCAPNIEVLATHGGGTLCVHDADLAQTFRNAVESVNSC